MLPTVKNTTMVSSEYHRDIITPTRGQIRAVF